MWKISKLTDKSEILAYLETDCRYAAYAIGDLEPGMFEQCTWVGAKEAGQLQALALHFCGLKLPALLMMGDADGLRAILAKSALYPDQAYLTCRSEHLTMVRDFYVWEKMTPMWRMVLQSASFRPVESGCIRLELAHSDQLAALYALGEGNAFGPTQMQPGVFYGILSDGRLVAAAGTHLVSPTYGVAAVGNVFTHPDYQRRGCGTASASAVVAELLRLEIHNIILNVSQDNAAAIRIYERLGFERYCPFLEGPVSAVRVTATAD